MKMFSSLSVAAVITMLAGSLNSASAQSTPSKAAPEIGRAHV